MNFRPRNSHPPTQHARGLILINALAESVVVMAMIAVAGWLLWSCWPQGSSATSELASHARPYYDVRPHATEHAVWAVQQGTGIRLLDSLTGDQILGWSLPEGGVSHIKFAAGRNDLAVMSDRQTISFLRRGTEFATESLPPDAGLVTGIAFSPAADRVAVVTNRGSVLVFAIVDDSVSQQGMSSLEPLNALAWSPCGSRIALSVSVNEEVALLDVATMTIGACWHAHRDGCTALMWSPDGRRLATVGRDTYVRLWDVARESLLWEHVADSIDPSSLAFDRTGTRLVTGGFNRHVAVWDVETGEQIERLAGHRGVIRSLAFSADGETLYTGGLDGQLFAWNWATRTVSRKF